MTRRTPEHVTDTLAIREVLYSIPENWLVRGLEERDYGIDLSIEKYDGEKPTGSFSLIQVKGTKNQFPGRVVLNNFPTKTLEYAELFPEAFFIFYVSIEDKKTYFVWVQKYIEAKLSSDNPEWREQGSNTIYFPPENVLGTEEGNSKIGRAIDFLSAQRSGLSYLSDLETLKLHWEGYKCGNHEVVETCLESAKRLNAHQVFYDVYGDLFFGEGRAEIVRLLEDLSLNPINDLDRLTEDDCRRLCSVDAQLGKFEAVKLSFLNQREIDCLQAEITDDAPF
ncbi:protein of unknown function [Thiohalospira halophila DSM 15071]|uniref:DUF4365 domain-containing protein n=1 Tax=Thiohalospira halophila DSM 15071 TaxID=1123397 RepID=A0A1I1WHC8_9GAMM|nr:DUF4365 domain-containing protein [Thiohalospira halophila]SFD94389.1 protein of unknown function [Thiohalospira halophila DSM 15071]